MIGTNSWINDYHKKGLGKNTQFRFKTNNTKCKIYSEIYWEQKTWKNADYFENHLVSVFEI